MKKKKWLIGCIICILIACICGAYIAHYYWEESQNKSIYNEVRKENTKPNVEKKDSEPEEKQTDEEIPINFDELEKMNPDIYAWITIPGTNIDYPIVQHPTNDEYYLMHTIEGKEGYPGSIYTENYNKKDFSDFNTVIYGHDMNDGSMFQNLHNYSDQEYMRQHPEVVIYTRGHAYRYKIFAAVVYDDRHLMGTFDFTAAQGKQAFLDSVLNSRDMGNCFAENVTVTPENQVVTLSTCIASRPDNRFLVGAVLEK